VNALYIALAIPVFFLLIGLEILWNRRHGDPGHRFDDSITDLGCGVGVLVHETFFVAITVGLYTLVWSQLALFDLGEGSLLAWIGVIVGVDFFYYWYHRASHRVNVLWANHVVHHQSEEYNLAVALRQSWYGPLFEWVFYVPLALLGFPPLLFLASKTISRLYQFWIHTESIRRLGPLEAVLNTPSHHRVHHAVNPRYIDKNYGGILITWDKLFGTFEPERDEAVYGTVKPLESWNPFWANLANWVQLARMARATRRWRDKLAVWFAPPEWQPADLGGPVTVPEVRRADRPKYTRPLTAAVKWYVGSNFAVVGAVLTVFLLVRESLPTVELLGIGAWILAAVTSWGALFERRGWGARLEGGRLLATVPLAGWVLAGHVPHTLALGGSLVFSAAMLGWLWRLRGDVGVTPGARVAPASLGTEPSPPVAS
jgi:alkylglycerol monooxygenase